MANEMIDIRDSNCNTRGKGKRHVIDCEKDECLGGC